MNRKKLFVQAMTALGGAALSLSLLPAGARADMMSDDRLSPAPSNNPTEANTVNGTNLPVWTINGGEQITFPSTYLNVYSTDRSNLSIRELNSRPINPNASTAPITTDRIGSTAGDANTSLAPTDNGTSEPMMMNNSQEGVYIPSGQGRTSGSSGGPSRDPLPTSGDKGGNKPAATTSERNTPATSNTPGRANTNNGTTIPEQVINENREINVPSERTNTRPSETRTNSGTNNRTNTRTNTTRTDSETQNLDITPQVPSGQAPATGNTGGPPRGPSSGSTNPMK